LRERVMLVGSLTAALMAGFLLPHRDYWHDPMARLAISYVSSLSLLAIAVGHLSFRILRQSFYQSLFTEHLERAREDERARISRELHDELGQQMSALTLKLAMLRKAQPKGVVRTELEALEKIALDTDNGLDFLVWQLRPTALDDLGLVAALDDYVHDWSSHFGIEAHICVNRNEAVRLDPEIETVLYRVVQEALNNVAKYAKARHVEVRLERDASHVSLDIHDDGVGFDPQSIAAAKGLGLVGMRERATLIGGELAISSVPGAGTSIRVHVPLLLAP
jgi:signal transduction histidine kinase